MLIFGKKKLVIDIGESTTKMGVFRLSKNRCELMQFRIFPTPSGSVAKGQIKREGLLSQAINSYHHELQQRFKSAISGLEGGSVFARKTSVPKMNLQLLGEYLRFEAEQYVPFEIGMEALRFEPIDMDSAIDTMDILLIAAEKDRVDSQMRFLKEARLESEMLTLNSLAVAKSYMFNYPSHLAVTSAVVHLGSTLSHFVVVHHGQVIFCKDLHFGGSDVTGQLAERMEMSDSDAESMKTALYSDPDTPQEVFNQVDASNAVLVEKVKEAFVYFKESEPKLKVDRIYFSGGPLLEPRLLERFGEAFQTPCHLHNPFERVQVHSSLKTKNLSKLKPQMAVMVGLALRSRV